MRLASSLPLTCQRVKQRPWKGFEAQTHTQLHQELGDPNIQQ